MDDIESVTMDEAERDAFLGAGGTGVISYARATDEPPYAVPVSYGYDAAEETFYFRLAVGPGGEKSDLAGRAVTFVTHGETDRYRSVVASGRLEPTDEKGIGTDAMEGLRRVHIPLHDVFERPPSEVAFEFHRLVPDELTTRVESTAPTNG
ncbi:pyridoxamine 5'-phosphate oxidase family protein [Haloglomus salinum]|jgi:nitroimidazol reductase NimA-like FMN-containing flavoprotein (pyridoxamine 5'-phosphate oxidase superfamily)|uniref:pyridoxamine 5'-phosphate oxidase family protein n=1 Tax=Haloglomus salinum TaxID=2962673 RepID=UPI0020C992C1|nr:pyridoxamine 5'-phosphate oxidase family protein [Haloglomus salinum]